RRHDPPALLRAYDDARAPPGPRRRREPRLVLGQGAPAGDRRGLAAEPRAPREPAPARLPPDRDRGRDRPARRCAAEPRRHRRLLRLLAALRLVAERAQLGELRAAHAGSPTARRAPRSPPPPRPRG